MCLISAFIFFVHIYLNFFVLAKLVIRITFAFVGQYYALKGAADVDVSFNIILLNTMMMQFLGTTWICYLTYINDGRSESSVRN